MALKQIISQLKFRLLHSWKAISALGIILLAGALIEGLSLLQYNYTHRLMEDELDYRVESELTMKSMRVKGILKSHERLVHNSTWYIANNLNRPNSIYDVIRRMVISNNSIENCFVAFKPGYYSDRERLFEPTAVRTPSGVIDKQMASASHDYTKLEFYNLAVEKNMSAWSDPYDDVDASGEQVITYAVPVVDGAGQPVAAFGIDLSTRDIIDTLNSRNTYHNYPSSFFLLLTEDGQLISQPDSSHTRSCDVDDVVRIVNDSSYVRKPSVTGHSRYIRFRDSKGDQGSAYYAFMKGKPHWQIVMVCYDDEVFEKLKHMRLNLWLMMLAGFSLLGFIIYRFNRNINRLHESKLSKERTDSELRIAQKIQAEMLPSISIARPDIIISGKQVTALEVGGDLYDYFIRDEKLFFCIGDVSGKGVPSSLVMAVVHSLFHSLAQHESNPARLMQSVNHAACEGNKTNMFVTLFIGVLDLPSGRLRFCNAGHDAPLIINNDVSLLEVNANLPIGVFSDFKYEQQQVTLASDTTLFLYTDGLTEANDHSGALFRLQRVIDTANICCQRGTTAPGQVMDTMYDAVCQYASGAQQTDDLTMLALRYVHPQEVVVLNETITLDNDVRQVPQLNNFVQSVASRLNLSSSVASQLMLAVEEAVVNVMNYAYPIGTHGEVSIEAIASEVSVKFIITDQGKAFDPTLGGNADTTLSAEERPIGGLGILLVQQLMDTINYERVDGKNVLTIKKMIKKDN